METILGLGLTALAFLAWSLLGEVIAELLKPLRVLYRPPYGAWLLALTWVTSIALFVAAFAVADRSPGWAGVMAVGAPAVALIASLTYRDQRRDFLGRPPVWLEVTRLSAFSRFAAGLSAIVFSLTATMLVIMAVSEGISRDALPMWAGVAGGIVGAYWLGYAAMRGKFPRSAGYVE